MLGLLVGALIVLRPTYIVRWLWCKSRFTTVCSDHHQIHRVLRLLCWAEGRCSLSHGTRAVKIIECVRLLLICSVMIERMPSDLRGCIHAEKVAAGYTRELIYFHAANHFDLLIIDQWFVRKKILCCGLKVKPWPVIAQTKSGRRCLLWR